MSALAFAHLKESTAVDAAATAAIDLVRELSERDPHDKDEANPWRNPEQVFQQLDQARTGIVNAWEELHAAAAALEQTDHANAANTTNSSNMDTTKEPLSTSTSVDEDDLRAAYMDMITDAFADVLEDLRANEAEDIDVGVLVDCLQSGLDLMSQEEKDFFMQDNEELNNMDESESNDIAVTVTPHELRRRELGFNMKIPSA
jgi:Mg2+ and Co2+ transporter CorA